MGSIEAADRYNRDYLKPRNLSFNTSIKEASLGLETSLLDLSTTRFTPYVYGSISLYHFNPWAYDNSGKKVFLQPLSTEGQGLPQYSKQKPYKLTQRNNTNPFPMVFLFVRHGRDRRFLPVIHHHDMPFQLL